MNELIIKIEVPELTSAITCLADAIDRVATSAPILRLPPIQADET